MHNLSSKKQSFCVAKGSMRWLSALQNIFHKIINQMKSLQMCIAWLGSGWQKLDLASYITFTLFVIYFLCHQPNANIFPFFVFWILYSRWKCSSRTILEKYLKPAVSLAENERTVDKKSIERLGQAHFHLAHYADALFRSYEERLTSNEWHAATRLRKHKVTQSTPEQHLKLCYIRRSCNSMLIFVPQTKELEALCKRLKSSKVKLQSLIYFLFGCFLKQEP